MNNSLKKKLSMSENKMFNALISIANEDKLSDLEVAFCVNRLAFHWTQLELMQKVGDAECTQDS